MIFLWGGMGRVADGLHRLADEWRRSNNNAVADAARADAQNAILLRNADAAEAIVRSREAWEAEERAHMTVCERRYRALREGESMDKVPVSAQPRRH